MFIEAGGHRLSTVQIGTGPRTLVTHGGWAGSWELWLEPLQLMQEQWRGIAYDHRGSGVSTAPPTSVLRSWSTISSSCSTGTASTGASWPPSRWGR